MLAVRTSGIERLESRIAPAAIVVANLLDSGPGSLRAALAQADADAAGDEITFQHGLHGTIHLQSDLPAITASVSIAGPGASHLHVDGEKHAIFAVTGTDPISVSLAGLTLTHGQAANGGALFINDAAASVEVTRMVITGNRAVGGGGSNQDPNPHASGYGGGIAVAAGNLSVTRTVVSHNQAGEFTTFLQHGEDIFGWLVDGLGGGICVEALGTMTISGSRINNNVAGVGGGAMVMLSGALDLSGTRVFHNTAEEEGGGGMAIVGSSTVTHSFIYENLARGGFGVGGGILNDNFGVTVVAGSIIANNFAVGLPQPGDTGAPAEGGGISNFGDLTIRTSVIAGNEAIGAPGARGTNAAAAAGKAPGDFTEVQGATGHFGGAGHAGGFAEGGGLDNEGTLHLDFRTVIITGNIAASGAGGAGGNGGAGGTGAAGQFASLRTNGTTNPGIPAGPGGWGGDGGAGGAGGFAAGGGFYDGTGKYHFAFSGNATVAGHRGSTGAPGAIGNMGGMLSGDVFAVVLGGTESGGLTITGTFGAGVGYSSSTGDSGTVTRAPNPGG